MNELLHHTALFDVIFIHDRNSVLVKLMPVSKRGSMAIHKFSLTITNCLRACVMSHQGPWLLSKIHVKFHVD